MEFDITKEQRELRQEIINFAKDNLNVPEYLEHYSPELFQKAAEFGLLGLTVSEEFGGLDESYLTAAIAFEALGYACKNNGLIFVINNHIWVGQNLIYLYGSDYLKKRYVSSMVKGERIGAIAITEAESGSDAFSMVTTAKEDGENFIINGNKMFISNGPVADIFIVFAVTETKPSKKYTAFVVERNTSGLKVGANILKMGLESCPTSEITFENCVIPKENILGQVNQGGSLLTFALEWERCYEFVPHIGAMQRIMENCIEHVNYRRQFGKAIREYQSISHKIAEMQVAIELSRLMMYKIATIKDKKKSAFMEASIFKLYVSENYIKTCREAVQIFGAYGYTKEYDLERELRDSLASSIYSGTNEMQKNTIFDMASMNGF